MLNPRKIKHLQEDQQLKEEQKMNITYHEENGYLLPNIVVGCDTSRPIGKYGRMRRKYLQEHRPILFSVMVQDGTLFEHLAEVEDAAQSRLETIVPALAKAAGATEALKGCLSDEMGWHHERLQSPGGRSDSSRNHLRIISYHYPCHEKRGVPSTG